MRVTWCYLSYRLEKNISKTDFNIEIEDCMFLNYKLCVDLVLSQTSHSGEGVVRGGVNALVNCYCLWDSRAFVLVSLARFPHLPRAPID